MGLMRAQVPGATRASHNSPPSHASHLPAALPPVPRWRENRSSALRHCRVPATRHPICPHLRCPPRLLPRPRRCIGSLERRAHAGQISKACRRERLSRRSRPGEGAFNQGYVLASRHLISKRWLDRTNENMTRQFMLLPWGISCALFWGACFVQQTWFRAQTPVRSVFYGLEAVTCILFLLAGLEFARPHRNRFDFHAGVSTLLGGIASVLIAGFVISLFLRPQCPFHGEWSLFFFILPAGLLALAAPAYWIAAFALRKQMEAANNSLDHNA